MIKIAPSIASGPLTHLASTLKELEKGGVDIIHFDIEDGNFVPEIRIGIKMIKELRPLTKLPFDVHLMVKDPEWMIPILADYGVDSVSVHFEACPYPRRTLQIIAQHKMQAGLAFNPATPIPELAFCTPYLSFILVLSTDPEKDNPAYLPTVLEKIKSGKSMNGLEKITWVADGGITSENAGEVAAAGADVLIVGRGIFRGGEIGKNFLAIKKAIKQV